MFKKATLAALVAACGFGFASSAYAQQAYVGASGGVSNWSVDCAGTTSCDKSGSSFKLFGGYDINPNFAVEGAYASLGKATATGVIAGVGNVAVESKASGFELAGVFKAPFSKEFTGFAKLGVSFMKGEASAVAGAQAGSSSENSTNLLAGLGVSYAVTKDVAIRGEWETRKVKVAGDSGNVSNFTAGVQFNF